VKSVTNTPKHNRNLTVTDNAEGRYLYSTTVVDNINPTITAAPVTVNVDAASCGPTIKLMLPLGFTANLLTTA
jgi:hypothetical protein